MENNLSLSPTQLTAIEETLSSMTRGFEKRPLVDSLLLTLFPEQNPKFLRSWGSLRYTHLKMTAFPERQLWILKNMVEGVISGAAQDWYKGYLEEYPGA
jgi:hypothetical protein